VQNQPPPLILSFGAFDPVGAAGITADRQVFAALGCHGLAVPTALLVGDTARIEDVQELDTGWMVDQARVMLEDMRVAAIKVGAMLNPEQVSAIAEIVSDYPDVPLIVDPFLSGLPEHGDEDDDLLGALSQVLAPQATVLQLSLLELGRLAEGWRDPADGDMAGLDAAELTSTGCAFVLVNCSEPGQNTLYDIDGEVARYPWRRLPGNFAGAGTVQSAALAALLARGLEVPAAVEAAHAYTLAALAHGQRFGMGKFVPNPFFQEPRHD
jgi:hydroxymethylpyrimidine/phosphomethylpyrimidine kinase